VVSFHSLYQRTFEFNPVRSPDPVIWALSVCIPQCISYDRMQPPFNHILCNSSIPIQCNYRRAPINPPSPIQPIVLKPSSLLPLHSYSIIINDRHSLACFCVGFCLSIVQTPCKSPKKITTLKNVGVPNAEEMLCIIIIVPLVLLDFKISVVF
jgi:hypothetical protein